MLKGNRLHPSIIIRRETPADYQAVEALTREAFWNHYGPGCDEHYLAHILRDSDDFIADLDCVAEIDGKIVGNIMYTKSRIALDSGGDLAILTFGPLSVLPAYQNQGVGSALVRHTLTLAQTLGYTAVIILGDPAYYSRLGFQPAEAFGIAANSNMFLASLQAYELKPGALQSACGLFHESPAYHMDNKASEAFDKTFPAKEKLTGTPSQQRFAEVVSMKKPR